MSLTYLFFFSIDVNELARVMSKFDGLKRSIDGSDNLISLSR